MTFNSAVESCVWAEKSGKWQVTIQDVLTGETRSDTCDILIGANGLLNSYKYPEEVEGLRSFTGRLVHTARWPDEYGPSQWKNDRVAVLGSGASSIQTGPTMQPHAKSLDVFVRTPIWFAEIADHSGDNFDCESRPSI